MTSKQTVLLLKVLTSHYLDSDLYYIFHNDHSKRQLRTCRILKHKKLFFQMKECSVEDNSKSKQFQAACEKRTSRKIRGLVCNGKKDSCKTEEVLKNFCSESLRMLCLVMCTPREGRGKENEGMKEELMFDRWISICGRYETRRQRISWMTIALSSQSWLFIIKSLQFKSSRHLRTGTVNMVFLLENWIQLLFCWLVTSKRARKSFAIRCL